MRLLQVAVLALGLAASPSFAHEAPDRDSPDRKRDQSVDDYYATSWTETVTRGGSVVVIVHPHAQTHPHQGTSTNDDVPSASTAAASPEPSALSSSDTSRSADTPPASNATANSPDTPNPQSTEDWAPPPPPRITATVLGSPFGNPAEISPMETYSTGSASETATPMQQEPIDSSQVQVCTGGSYTHCVASYSCASEKSAARQCYCRNNVREGCNNACGGHQKLQPEECPPLPVGERPPDLPSAGSIPRLRRRNRASGRRGEDEPGWWKVIVNAWGVWQVGEGDQ